jgi:NosR/NirI family nitrous oxide reductase transcriptional regulator
MRNVLQRVLDSPNLASPRPVVNEKLESNIPGLFIIGDLVGAPVVKLAMEHGNSVAEHIAGQPDARGAAPGTYDLIVVGAGAAGLNAALVAQDRGLRVLVLEKGKFANTIEDFPEGKWVYAEPDSRPPKGKLWIDGATKEDLLARWMEIVHANGLDVRTEEGVSGIVKQTAGEFAVRTSKGEYKAKRVVLATGQRGNPRKLGVPGQDREHVYHRLYSPKHYHGEDIVVVGGGNSAVEAALTLCENNRVVLSYRGAEFSRLFKGNAAKLEQAVRERKLTVLYNSEVKAFGEKTCTLQVTPGGEKNIPCDHAFVLIGAEVSADFLRSMGVRLENDWTGNPWLAAALVLVSMFGLWMFGGHNAPGAALAAASIAALVYTGARGNRYSWLGFSFLIAYTIYGAKLGDGGELWPYRGWGYKAFSLFGRPWSFWYTVLYTGVMTVFGIEAMKRWGVDRKDRFQIWRYTSLIGFQWLFFFLIPEFLFQYAVKYQWVGA